MALAGDDLFTPRQTEQQDAVDNLCHRLLCDLAGQELEWDVEHYGEVRDAAQEVIVDKLGLMTEMDFYPYVLLERANASTYSLKWIGDAETDKCQLEIYECTRCGFHIGLDFTFLDQVDTEVIFVICPSCRNVYKKDTDCPWANEITGNLQPNTNGTWECSANAVCPKLGDGTRCPLI